MGGIIKFIVLTLFSIWLCNSVVHAQKNIVYAYLDSNGDNCDKSGAIYYSRLFKQNKLWVKEVYSTKTNLLNMVATYSDKACTTLEGMSAWYLPNGKTEFAVDFFEGIPKTKTYYYPNGNKKAFMSFVYNINRSWDEDGNELKNMILAKDAKPGSFSWITYLQDNLSDRVAIEAGLPVGLYKVKVNFVVDTLGRITNVKAVSVPPKCIQCGAEAVRVINNSPAWIPAVKDNRPSIFEASQVITFEVEDVRAERSRGVVAIASSVLRLLF